MKIFLCCKACKGSGRVLSDELTRTAMAIPTRRSVTIREIADALGEPIVRTAINNRVAKLREMGVVARSGTKGRMQFFQRVKIK